MAANPITTLDKRISGPIECVIWPGFRWPQLVGNGLQKSCAGLQFRAQMTGRDVQIRAYSLRRRKMKADRQGVQSEKG